MFRKYAGVVGGVSGVGDAPRIPAPGEFPSQTQDGVRLSGADESLRQSHEVLVVGARCSLRQGVGSRVVQDGNSQNQPVPRPSPSIEHPAEGPAGAVDLAPRSRREVVLDHGDVRSGGGGEARRPGGVGGSGVDTDGRRWRRGVHRWFRCDGGRRCGRSCGDRCRGRGGRLCCGRCRRGGGRHGRRRGGGRSSRGGNESATSAGVGRCRPGVGVVGRGEDSRGRGGHRQYQQSGDDLLGSSENLVETAQVAHLTYLVR